jgi:hypothetical protein
VQAKFRLFKPEPRDQRTLRRSPGDLAILGFFHDLARFLTTYQSSRIVNVTDIKISLARGVGGLHPHDQLSLNHLPISGTPEAAGKRCEPRQTIRGNEPHAADHARGDGHWYGCDANGV